jgi:hypothetical protein
LSIRLNHFPPFTPCSRAANIRSVQADRSTQSHRFQVSPACLASAGTVAGCVSICLSIAYPPSCHPFAPPALPGFIATMGGSDSCAAGSSSPSGENEHRPFRRTGLPTYMFGLPEHSVPSHLARPRHRFCTQPFSVTGFRNRSLPDCRPGALSRSGLHHCEAGSSLRPGRIGFVILRTARSPPVALHISFRRCSYFRLQAGVCMPGEDLHLSDQTHSSAHFTSQASWLGSSSCVPCERSASQAAARALDGK